MFENIKPHLLEIALIVGMYLLYLLARGLAVVELESSALSHAKLIVSLEKSFGIFWESRWQSWALENARPLVVALNWVYIATYWPVIFIMGLVLYIRERPVYYYYRNVILVGFVAALAIFTVFPLAPPFLASSVLGLDQMSDTIQELGPSFYGGSEMARFYNTYAAMPSLHFTWTAVLGVLLVRRSRGPWKSLGAAYPVLTFFAIIITGNHFILDAVAGGLLAGFSIGLVELRTRLHVRRGSPRVVGLNSLVINT